MQNKSFLNNILKGISKRTTKILNNPYSTLNINPAKLIYLKHLSTGPLRRHQMLGANLYYYNAQELLHGLKELFIDEIYKIDLPPQAYIVDCGANIGMSVIYLKKLAPDATLVAFEPDAKNFELLTKNTGSYKLYNVELRKEAVWIENTTLSFASEGSMSSKIDATANNSNQVQAIRLKDFINRQIHLLKIDIEGAEYEVLKDIEPVLHHVDNLFLEYHGTFDQINELTHIFNMLHSNGFQYYIKEAAEVYEHPFLQEKPLHMQYDIQLNIFCFKRSA